MRIICGLLKVFVIQICSVNVSKQTLDFFLFQFGEIGSKIGLLTSSLCWKSNLTRVQ